MTLPAGLAGHVHVSERESAHHWPDGRFDDAAWEDCQVCAGVMQARLAHDLDIPPLHREAEALRADEGEDPHGGTGTDDLIRGFRVRYGFTAGQKVAGSSGLITALKPNMVAIVQGWMGAFGSDHRLRRWQRSFYQAHGTMVARFGPGIDDLWWDDPLAPTGGYQGEKITRDELRRFVDALATHFTPLALVAPITARIALPDTSTEPPQRVRVAKGSWWDYVVSGSTPHLRATRISRITAGGFSAEIGRREIVLYGGADRHLAQLSSGVYQRRWVDLDDKGSVTLLAA